MYIYDACVYKLCVFKNQLYALLNNGPTFYLGILAYLVASVGQIKNITIF